MILVLLAFGAAARQLVLTGCCVIGIKGWLAPMKVVLRPRGFMQSAGIGHDSETTLNKSGAETLRNDVVCRR